VITGDGLEAYDHPPQALSSYAAELEAFADCVAGEAHGPTTGESERRSLAVVQTGYESVESGLPGRLSDRFAEL